MASVENTGVATENEDSDTGMGGSGSKSKEDRIRVSGSEENGDDGSGGGEPVGESEIVVPATNDCDSEKQKIGIEKVVVCDGYTNGSSSLSDSAEGVNGGIGNDGKGKDGDSSLEDDKGADSTKVNGVGSDDPNLDVDKDENGEKDGAKAEDDQNIQFRVGDLVWGKIRSHPWWPGQVYDPNDASEFALKSKLKGRVLVAFFGDSSWSWCLSSQLVPFVENFAEMSRKSCSRSFINAVQSAINEVGRLVESEMACNCVSKGKRDGLARPVVENAGVKVGVLVPEVDSNRLSIRKYESKELHGKVKQFARTVSVDNPVDLAVLRSCLSVFYDLKGGYQLASYQDPLPVEGLEDKNDDVDEVANAINVPIDVPIVGPKDEDWHSSPTSGTVNSPSTSGNKVFHKRKRKSVAELMGDNKNAVGKSASSQKKKKGKGGGAEDAGTEGVSSLGKTEKRKVENIESPIVTGERCMDAEKNGVNKGTSSGKSKNVKVPEIKIPSDEAKEDPDMVSTPRERKKSKYLSPPYTTPTWRIGNLSLRASSQVEQDKNPQSGGCTTEPTEEQSTSEPVSESTDKTTAEKLPNRQLERSDGSADVRRETIKDDKNMTSSVSDVHASVSRLLIQTRLAAVDPFYLSQEGSLDSVWAFIYALRTSTYVHGANYKIYQKCKTRGKRKFRSSQVGNEVTQTKVNPPDQNASNELKTGELSDSSKSKNLAETSLKSNTKKVDGKAFPCFIMEFAPDFPLPSKEDILKLFGKFGSLSRKDIKILTKTHTVEMYFAKYSDAEAAFKSSMRECPFGFKNVTCRLPHPSTSPKSRRKRAPDTQEDDLISDARGIKQKAKMMTAILESQQSKFSVEDRCNLKEEMKYVLEKVKAIGDKVRFIAEKNSSSS